jgi:hypothetical protein
VTLTHQQRRGKPYGVAGGARVRHPGRVASGEPEVPAQLYRLASGRGSGGLAPEARPPTTAAPAIDKQDAQQVTPPKLSRRFYRLGSMLARVRLIQVVANPPRRAPPSERLLQRRLSAVTSGCRLIRDILASKLNVSLAGTHAWVTLTGVCSAAEVPCAGALRTDHAYSRLSATVYLDAPQVR